MRDNAALGIAVVIAVIVLVAFVTALLYLWVTAPAPT
jgi:hypothetical protein